MLSRGGQVTSLDLFEEPGMLVASLAASVQGHDELEGLFSQNDSQIL